MAMIGDLALQSNFFIFYAKRIRYPQRIQTLHSVKCNTLTEISLISP